ncbi:hypothetical protein BDN72DRAFT_802489 [Pluteus cervinus]|uniref:Uncharacterized protein n=1 Tax=Pluteus cervinus TaxID=181527 RepID=A0ACD3AFI2_9AGAR|nr:hypothetical protein BDN72DRAFT_802489 [Pluteus cervinus]
MAESVVDERDLISTKVVLPKVDGSEDIVFVSKKFCHSSADIAIISSDDVQFKLHKKNLAFNTGGFPPLEFARGTNIELEQVNLSERGYILDLLFQFAYPQRYPDVKSLAVDILSELADAAEKYEVYGAISVCDIVMRFTIPTHPVEVFAYATRYNYLDLADEAAPFVLGTPLSDLADKLSADALTGWIRYLAWWDTFSRLWTKYLIQSTMKSRNTICLKGDCLEECTTLITTLGASMVSMKMLVDLTEKISCTHCKPYATALVTAATTKFSGAPKFRTYLRGQPGNTSDVV